MTQWKSERMSDEIIFLKLFKRSRIRSIGKKKIALEEQSAGTYIVTKEKALQLKKVKETIVLGPDILCEIRSSLTFIEKRKMSFRSVLFKQSGHLGFW